MDDASLVPAEEFRSPVSASIRSHAHGWTMIRFRPDEPPSDTDLERWVGESFRLLAPKRLVARLDA